jgi:Pilin accessory protein (PilO)
MHIATVGGKKYLLGLTWRVVAQGEKKALDRLIDDCGRYGVVLNTSAGQIIGFTDGSKQSEPSAAAALALAAMKRQDVQGGMMGIVEQIARDRYWVCAVNRGVPTGDFVGTEAAARDKANEFFGMGGYSVFTKTDIYRADIGQTLAEIVSEANIPYKSEVRAVKPPRVLIPILLIVFLGGYMGWNFLVKHSKETADTLRLQAQSAAAQMAQQQTIQEEFKRFETQYADALNNFRAVLTRPEPAAQMRAWLNVADRTPVILAGWGMQTIECTPIFCNFAYEKGPGNLTDFLGAARSMGDVQYDKATSATLTVVLDKLQPRSATLDTTPAGRPFYEQFVGLLQSNELVGMDMKVASPAPGTAMKAPDGTLRQIPYSKANFVLGSRTMAGLEGFGQVLSARNVSLERLTIDLKSIPHTSPWQLEGTYVTK